MAEDKKDAEDAQPPEQPDEGDSSDGELTVDDILAAASDDGQAADDAVMVLQSTLEERTRDLQRVTAEFQNYRKRVERDKARAGELATAGVLQSLLPVLDDLDRARDHGDLNGPFASVADQLANALAKHGLESFGSKGDPFDPQIHEAVAHMQMPNVDGPTCIDVMRSGYRLGDKLLRPALVAVAEPSDEPEPLQEPEPEPEGVEAAAAEDAPVEAAAAEAAAAEDAALDETLAEGEVVEGEVVAADAPAGTEPVEADHDEAETVATAESTAESDESEAEAAAEEPEASQDAEPESKKKQ